MIERTHYSDMISWRMELILERYDPKSTNLLATWEELTKTPLEV